MTLTAAELTILGLIVEQPRHGYDLERVIEERGVREWTDIGFSSIYYLLGRLSDRGHVVAEAGAGRRQVHRATPAGIAAAHDAALDALAQPHPLRPKILTGLANLPLLGPAEVVAALNRRRATVAERIRSVTAARDAQVPLPAPAEAIFSYSLTLLDAEASWLDAQVADATDRTTGENGA